jgi:hypothetical protein
MSEQAPLVSIVAVNHNGLAHVERFLAGVRASSYAPLELIVLDNASTDGAQRGSPLTMRSGSCGAAGSTSISSFAAGPPRSATAVEWPPRPPSGACACAIPLC